jgi:hypothetical protein
MCLFMYNYISSVGNMYQSFFLLFKATEFKYACGEVFYVFILYIVRQIIVIAFHLELLLVTLCFIEGEKKSGCIQRQSKKM